MKTPTSGQSGQNEQPKRDYEYERRPEAIPTPVLRDFIARLADQHGYLKLGKMLGLSKETVRKFDIGKGAPVRSTVRQFGRLYLEHHPEGYVAERKLPDGEREVVPQLKMVLPPGEEAAKEYVRKLVELAEAHPDLFPESPERLRWWLDTVLSAEYAAEARYEPRRRRRNGKAPPAG